MEKKAEKQTEFILTPEEGESEATVELIAGESETGAELRSESPNQLAETVAAPSGAEDMVQPNIDAKTISAPRPIENARLKQTKFWNRKKAFMLILVSSLFLLAAPTKYAYQWYCDAPRNTQKAPGLLVPCIWTAWTGDADSSYALQTIPIMIISSNSKEPKPEVDARNTTVKMLKRFWQESGSSQNHLSRIVGSVALASSGENDEAIRQLGPVIKDAQNPMLRTYNGVLLALNGELKQALHEADEGLRLSSPDRRSIIPSEKFANYWLKAQIYQTMGDPKQAIATLTSPECKGSLANDKTDLEVIENMTASCYIQLGESDKVISLFSGKNTADAQYFLALAYLLKNDFNKALQIANAMRPADHDQRREILLSRIACQQGKLDKALEFAQQAENSGRKLYTLEQLVYVLNQMGRYKESLSVSEDLRSHMGLTGPGAFRDLPQLRAGRAEAYLRMSNWSFALNEAQKALDLNPTCVKALEVARFASLRLNDPIRALEYENKLKTIPYVPAGR